MPLRADDGSAVPSRSGSVDWHSAGVVSGLCIRCRKREASTILRLFVQERARGKTAGKTLASRALRFCESCAHDVFVLTNGYVEKAAAGVRAPEQKAEDALRYAVAYMEADLDGKELTDSIDLDYLRAALP